MLPVMSLQLFDVHGAAGWRGRVKVLFHRRGIDAHMLICSYGFVLFLLFLILCVDGEAGYLFIHIYICIYIYIYVYIYIYIYIYAR